MRKKQSIKELKDEGVVKNASEIPEFPKIKEVFDERRLFIQKWITKIEAYCGEMGIIPSDLIETHRQSLKIAKKGLKQGKDKEIAKETFSNFRESLIKAKTGYSPK